MNELINTPLGVITLRPAQETDAQAFREIRLEALRAHPEAFGSDYETNEKFSPSHWVKRLRALGDDNMIHFAVHENDLIGICGIFRGNSKKTRHNANIYSVYVRPDWRGHHIAEGLIHLCFSWAQNRMLRIVKLAVVTNNTPAIRCYVRCGFTVYGIDPQVIYHDGVYYDELLMVRALK
jgi:RimJ/RimL family protein N-acetyltransferase